MALGKYYEEIIERRCGNNAFVVFEYQHPQASRELPNSREEVQSELLFTPEQVTTLRQFIEEFNLKYNERMGRERVVVYKWTTYNGPNTEWNLLGYMTKTAAAELSPYIGGELYQLDSVHVGIHVNGNYLFIADHAFLRGFQKMGSEAHLSSVVKYLFEQKKAAYDVALKRAA